MIGIILVNWNGCADTICCLSSILSTNKTNWPIHVCVVDNCSSDQSLDKIRQFLASSDFLETDTSHLGKYPDVRISSITSFRNRDNDGETIDITLVANLDNYGFAAANNIGVIALDYVTGEKCNYYWLLNNDTEIEPNCLDALCKKMEANPSLGVCGSTLIYYGSDNIVQAYGGVKYSLLTGRGVTLGNGSVLNLDAINESEIERQLTYISGASMFVRRDVFDKVGMLSEDYFLYYEEIDFSCRIKGLYLQGYAADSIVYHKEGASIGTGSIIRAPSLLSDYLQTKNKILFFRKFQKSSLLIVWLMGLMKVGKRIREGYYANARVILLALFGVFIPREKLVKR